MVKITSQEGEVSLQMAVHLHSFLNGTLELPPPPVDFIIKQKNRGILQDTKEKASTFASSDQQGVNNRNMVSIPSTSFPPVQPNRVESYSSYPTTTCTSRMMTQERHLARGVDLCFPPPVGSAMISRGYDLELAAAVSKLLCLEETLREEPPSHPFHILRTPSNGTPLPAGMRNRSRSAVSSPTSKKIPPPAHATPPPPPEKVPRAPEAAAQFTLIARVPGSTRRMDLMKVFGRYGRVQIAKVVCTKEARHPRREWTATAGYAFVRFASHDMALSANQAAANGEIVINGVVVRSSWAKVDSYVKS